MRHVLFSLILAAAVAAGGCEPPYVVLSGPENPEIMS